MIRKFPGVFVICCALVTAGKLSADDWPQFRGIDRDGKSKETGLWANLGANGPQLGWMKDGIGSGYASVSVVGNRIYTTGNTSEGQAVTALDVNDGAIVWQQLITPSVPRHDFSGSRSTPTVDGDRLYVVSSDGQIVCLNTDSGNIVWSRKFKDWNGKMMSGWGFSESPLVDGERVLCTPGGSDAIIVALDKLTGNEIWRSAMPTVTEEEPRRGRDGAGYASIMISNGGGVKQYVQLVGRGVIGVRASDGHLLWQYSLVANTTANIPTVLVDGDFIFCSTGYNTGSGLIKLASAPGNEVKMIEVYSLQADKLQNKHGGMILHDGHVFCGHGNGSGLPICIDIQDGAAAWGPVRGDGGGEASVLYADGHILFRFQDGTLSVVKASPTGYSSVAKFKPAFQQGKSWAYPVISNGKLYLREQNSLMCYLLK